MKEIIKDRDSGNIPYKLLTELHSLYLSRKHKILSDDISTKDETKEVWFELNDEMKNFLNEVLTDENVSGFRVYFITYPEKTTVMHGVSVPANSDDVNQLTIGIVTTKAGNGKGRKHIDYPESKTRAKMLLAPPMNHGELCPQKCD